MHCGSFRSAWHILGRYTSRFGVARASQQDGDPRNHYLNVVCLQPNLLNFEDPALNLHLLVLNITDTTFWFTVRVEVDVQDRPEPPSINDSSFAIAESDSGYPSNIVLGSGELALGHAPFESLLFPFTPPPPP